MPLVLDQGYNHPKWVDGGLEANVHAQERFRIGTIIDVVEKDGKWDAIIEITDPLAREAIENNEIPFFVSPRILHDPDEPDTAIKDWLLFHLAVVDEPAFGDKAKFKGACYGMAEQCQIALKSASKESCGFCVKTELLKLVTNHDSSLSSSFLPSPKTIPSMVDSPQTIDLSGYVPKGDYDALKNEVSTYKQANADLSKNFEEFKTSIEEDKRKSKITAVLSAKIADAKTRDERIKYFVDAKVAPEVVETAYKDIPDIQTNKGRDNTELFTGNKPADASVSNKAGSYAKASAYTNSIVRGASY